MDSRVLVTTVVVVPMRNLYRPPTHAKTPEQVTAFLGQFVSTIADMHPSERELEAVWEEVKRSRKSPFWPMPAEVCDALVEHRRKRGFVKRDEKTSEQKEWERRDELARLEQLVSGIKRGIYKEPIRRGVKDPDGYETISVPLAEIEERLASLRSMAQIRDFVS